MTYFSENDIDLSMSGVKNHQEPVWIGGKCILKEIDLGSLESLLLS